MSRIKDMTVGSPTKLIATFAFPLILGNLGQQLYMIVDAIIVGQGVGVEALASLGASDWIYWLVLWTVQAMTQGFAILVTQKFGAGDRQGLKQAVTMSVMLCTAMGILFTAVSLLMARPMLVLLKTPDNIFDGALSYLIAMFSGTLIVTAYNLASAILRSFGDGKTPLIAMGIAACTNIVLDLLFVMGFHWGITGAAVATLIAQLISFLYCLLVLRRNPYLRFTKADWRPDATVLLTLMKLGFPLALQHILIAVGGMVLQSVINPYGVELVAGFTATNKLYGLLESSAISFGFAITTYMAQNYGAGRMDRVRLGIRRAVVLLVGVAVGIAVLMIAVGKHLLRLFISAAPELEAAVLDSAYSYLFVMSLFLIILYLLFAYRSALQGLGNTWAPLLSGFLEFAMRIAVAYTFPAFLGAYGLFFAEPGAWLGAVAVLIPTYYWQVRRICRQQALQNTTEGAEGSGPAGIH